MPGLTELPIDSLIYMLQYLSPKEAAQVLDAPLSRRFVQDLGTQETAWRALSSSSTSQNFAKDSPRLFFIHFAMIPDRIDTATMNYALSNMNEFQHNVAIQELCIQRLGVLTEDEKCRVEFAQSNGIGSILTSMQRFNTIATVQAKGCRALVTAVRPLGLQEGVQFTGSRDATSVADEIGNYNGVSIILNAMKQHESDAVVQAMACWSLVNICLNDTQKAKVIQLGGMNQIVKSMITHENDREVQYRGLFVLVNLVTGTGNIMTEELARLIPSAIEYYKTDAPLIILACIVLKNLAIDEDNIPSLVAAGVESSLEYVMLRFETDPQLVGHAKTALIRIRSYHALPQLVHDNLVRSVMV